MFDFLPILITINLMASLFYATYNTPSGPAYRDKLKALLGTILLAFFGIGFIIVIEISKWKKL